MAPNKTAGQNCGAFGRASPPAKSLLTQFFLLENRREGKQLPCGGWRLPKINLSLFSRLSLPKAEDQRGAFWWRGDID